MPTARGFAGAGHDFFPRGAAHAKFSHDCVAAQDGIGCVGPGPDVTA